MKRICLFAVRGGIRSIKNIRNILKLGGEKVIISSYAIENAEFIEEVAMQFESSTILVCLDMKKSTGVDPVKFAELMEQKAAREIILNSIDQDGTMEEYDLDIITMISKNMTIPVVALGGTGKIQDFRLTVKEEYASVVAADSFLSIKELKEAF